MLKRKNTQMTWGRCEAILGYLVYADGILEVEAVSQCHLEHCLEVVRRVMAGN